MSVGEYSVEHFQSLPSLENARAKFNKLEGNDLVKEVFRKVFIDQGMERKFGLAMLHRHFDLEPGEMLVDYEGTSVPWSTGHISVRLPLGPSPLMVTSSQRSSATPKEVISLLEMMSYVYGTLQGIA